MDNKRLSEIQSARHIFHSVNTKRGVIYVNTPRLWDVIESQILKGTYLRCDNVQAALLVAIPSSGEGMIYAIRVEDFKKCDLQTLVDESYKNKKSYQF
jgi:hypothetical protein